MDSEIKGTKSPDMREVDNYKDTPIIHVGRLILGLGICGVILIGAVLLLP